MSDRKLSEKQLAARRWIDALRSGRYKQCALSTRQTTLLGFRYCAVGVYYDTIDWHSQHDYEARKMFGTDLVHKVIALNDVEGLSFSEIADYVEERVFQTNVKNDL